MIRHPGHRPAPTGISEFVEKVIRWHNCVTVYTVILVTAPCGMMTGSGAERSWR